MKLFLKLSFILTLALFEGNIFPQSSSSYSRIGLGDMVYTFSSRRTGLGELGVSVTDAEFISLLNPASLTGLRSTRTEFDMAYNGLYLSNNNASSYSASTDFYGAVLAIPISTTNGITLSFGLLPYSNVSYREENSYTSSGSIPYNYNVSYEGKGGLSKIFIASSYKFPFDLSVGATVDYYLGNLDYISTVTFPNDASLQTAKYTTRYRPRGFSSTLGLISPDFSKIFGSEKISDFRLGAVLTFSTNLKTDTSLIISSSASGDTLSNSSVNMFIPYRFAAGASFILSNKYLFTLDYLVQPWSQYSLNGNTSSYLRNSSKFSAGFEYKPEKQVGQSFWDEIIWRLGLSYEQTQYKVNGQGINEYSVMGGLSVPLSYQNTLDFGLQYAVRGTKDFNLLQEKIIRLTAGISLGELWFIRSEH